jgi:amidase
MKRRLFLKTAATSGGVMAILPIVSACKSPSENQDSPVAKSYTDFELNEATIEILQKKMTEGNITSLEIVLDYSNRIKTVDQSGVTLKAVIELNPDAEEIARQSDAERSSGKIRGPLHGIPVLVKDNINSADKMATSAGSLALKDFHAKKDAFIIEKLRLSGAVLLGKTNLSEWANFRSTNSSSGWSGRGGQVRNPYVIDRSPCGSSSGSGVAVAANLCTLAIGTETDGSIVCPSGINGIVGIKPTLGLWSRTGIIPIAFSQDTAGPMARTVTDAVYLLDALKGIDPNDSETLNSKDLTAIDLTKSLKRDGLKSSRIGILRSSFGFDIKVDSIMEEAIETMKTNGAEIVDNLKYDFDKELADCEWIVLLYEFKQSLNAYLVENSCEITSLEELIDYNKLNAAQEMPWFGQEVFEMAQAKGSTSEEEYKNALLRMKELSQDLGIDKLIEENKLDALIAPTNGPAWPIDPINGDHFKGGSSMLAATAGYPSITVPAGFIRDLPIGLSFIGKAWTEPKLIELAYSFEQNTLQRKIPQFIPTLKY